MDDNLTTSATTRETLVSVPSNVEYITLESDRPRGAGYTVVPHPPTPRDT